MSEKFEQQPATAQGLGQLAAEGILDQEQLHRALEMVGANASPQAWLSQLRRYLLGFAIALLTLGTIFFFAANWQEMSKWTRLGLCALGIVLSAGSATLVSLKKAAGQGLVTLSALFIGPFLAVYGQIYQTGADAYQLFVGWFLLILPFLFIARSQVLAYVALSLLNVGTTLYWLQIHANIGDNWQQWPTIIIGLSVVNCLACLQFEQKNKSSEMRSNSRFFPRIVATQVLIALMIPTCFTFAGEIPGYIMSYQGITLVSMCLGLIIAILWGYQQCVFDLYLVSIAASSLILLDSILIGRGLFEGLGLETSGALLLGVTVLLQMGALGKWILKLRERVSHTDQEAL